MAREMKTRNFLGKKRSGVILRSLLALCIFTIVAGCKKDSEVVPKEEEPIVSLSPLGQVTYEGTPILVTWSVVGKVSSFLVKKNGAFFSDSLVGSFLVSAPTENQKFEIEAVSESWEAIHRQLEIIIPGQQPLPEFEYAYTKGSILYDTEDTIFWSAKNATKVFYIFPDGNKMLLPVKGFLAMGKLKKDTIYHPLEAQGVGGTIVSSELKTIVAPPTFMDRITVSPLSVDSSHVSCTGEDGTWELAYTTQKDRDTRYVFQRNGTWIAYRYGVMVNYDLFSISEVDSIFVFGGRVCKILSFENGVMITTSQVSSFGCPGNIGFVKEFYLPKPL